jgi:outer membrane protein insertion porin family
MEAHLLEKIRLGPGDRYNYWKVQEDAQRLTRRLRDEDYLGAVIDVDSNPSGQDGVAVTYRIDPGPLIRILWEGDDPGESVRRDIEKAWDGRLPESFLLSVLASRATRELQVNRFYTARVEASASDAPNGVREVSFSVQKGRRGSRISLEFTGNQALSDAELTKALPSSGSADFFELISGETNRLQEFLRLHYASRGYLEARIAPPQQEYQGISGVYRVLIALEEGPLATVESLQLEGAKTLGVSQLMSSLELAKGRPFSFSAYTHDRSAVAAAYRRAGFPEVRIRGRLEPMDDRLRVIFSVDEGPQSKVGDIRVVGNSTTHEGVILRQMTFQEGDPLRLSDLTETQRKLYELGIFRSADVRAAPAGDDHVLRDVIIDVTEASDLNFGYGLRYNPEDDLELLTTLQFPNLFGTAQQAALSVTANRNRNVFRASYFTPYLWRHQLDTGVFVARESVEDEFFSDSFWSITFQQSKNILNKIDLQWSYTFRHSHTVGKITDSPFPFDFTAQQSILTTSLIEDRRDNFIQPSRGRFWNVTFQFAPEALGSDVKFIKLFGQLYTFFSLRPGVVWAASYRLGIADAFDQMLFPDDRFRAGGATTVRGFEQNSLGQEEPITGTVIGGEGLVVFNQELRFPIYRWVRGVAFYDAGNTFLEASDFRPFDLRHSAGAGARVVLPFGLLRFDWAWILDRQPGEKAYQFWFSLNHAF